MVENISVSELKKLSNANIIDIRDIGSYDNGYIKNSINIPYDKLILYPNKYLNKMEKYYIYCQRGNKSKTVCQILNSNGYNTVNVLGGYESWISSK